MHHVLTITYTQPIEVVDQTRPAHIDWVKAQIDAGKLLLAGRQETGAGGILVTSDIEPADVEAMIATDPYLLAGVAEYDRVGFNAGLRGPGL
ncbi:YciI family protein [Mycolicibacterium brumae]|uniref:GTP cyclohydrolase n=1 Tax=Mycolicibacterium brumae TaxID=85968 RepID=A0A2G5P8E4_9MYCO|nr:YciI family protein [Mycolicibacterium brumae]MCV7194816.1 GTP cyclohydrolase [Mycolicibacterium brumae]PIB74527.1 GTP cyclohydrolase [Mycolicibacterium brumae]RWA19765.1 hypothetical protein MBRU_16375 [Mycolicibacterium brumae DSM 44177]UWW09542.1 YciI family protein [Mycolicibacterium brumae]